MKAPMHFVSPLSVQRGAKLVVKHVTTKDGEHIAVRTTDVTSVGPCSTPEKWHINNGCYDIRFTETVPVLI